MNLFKITLKNSDSGFEFTTPMLANTDEEIYDYFSKANLSYILYRVEGPFTEENYPYEDLKITPVEAKDYEDSLFVKIIKWFNVAMLAAMIGLLIYLSIRSKYGQ